MILIFSAFMIASPLFPSHAATPAEAFAKGCGGCHDSERKILRKIPVGPDPVRRTWILNFMAGHPNERDALKPEIIEYLMEKSEGSKRWWQF